MKEREKNFTGQCASNKGPYKEGTCSKLWHISALQKPPPPSQKKKHYIVYFSASQSASQLSLYYRLEYIDRSSESMKVMTPTITFGFSDFQGARERELPPPGSYFKHVPYVGWSIYYM